MPPLLQARFDAMHRNGERLRRLINQLLDLSKLEVGQLNLHARERDLIPFVREIVRSFSALAERRRLTLQCHADVERLSLYLDADKLEKIVANLLSNALKFTPEGGKVWVSISEAEAGAPDSAVTSFAEIRVKDTGSGIPADEVPYVFDRFHQVDTSLTRQHEGTGIGLALTKELVELHGGTIRVESEVGFGTTFTVRLPRGKDHLSPEDLVEGGTAESVDPTPWSSSTASELAHLEYDVDADAPDLEFDHRPPDSSAPKVLVVEDNADVRAYLKDHLAPRYHVYEATDGEEGLAQARAIRPDLVVSDVMMPRMDGMELCRTLKQDERLRDVPVILLTAKATTDSKLEGLTLGADDYIFKPFDARILLARVENLIAIRRILRERFSSKVRIGPSEITVSSEEAAFVKKVCDVIEAHMADTNFGVDWLADELGMGRRHLQRKLRKAADLTPAGYIRMMRLERAAQLLEQRAGSVAKVAYRVGFRNADHFSRLFHSVMGVPPSQYPPKQD